MIIKNEFLLFQVQSIQNIIKLTQILIFLEVNSNPEVVLPHIFLKFSSNLFLNTH
jgi:hypothetical protein